MTDTCTPGLMATSMRRSWAGWPGGKAEASGPIVPSVPVADEPLPVMQFGTLVDDWAEVLRRERIQGQTLSPCDGLSRCAHPVVYF